MSRMAPSLATRLISRKVGMEQIKCSRQCEVRIKSMVQSSKGSRSLVRFRTESKPGFGTLSIPKHASSFLGPQPRSTRVIKISSFSFATLVSAARHRWLILLVASDEFSRRVRHGCNSLDACLKILAPQTVTFCCCRSSCNKPRVSG